MEIVLLMVLCVVRITKADFFTIKVHINQFKTKQNKESFSQSFIPKCISHQPRVVISPIPLSRLYIITYVHVCNSVTSRSIYTFILIMIHDSTQLTIDLYVIDTYVKFNVR